MRKGGGCISEIENLIFDSHVSGIYGLLRDNLWPTLGIYGLENLPFRGIISSAMLPRNIEVESGVLHPRLRDAITCWNENKNEIVNYVNIRQNVLVPSVRENYDSIKFSDYPESIIDKISRQIDAIEMDFIGGSSMEIAAVGLILGILHFIVLTNKHKILIISLILITITIICNI